MSLAGARVLLTGASGGIGGALRDQLLARGARVVAVSRGSAAASRAAEPGADPSRLLWVRGDLCDAAFRAALMARVREWGDGGLDVLVNAAGRGDFALLEDQDARGIEALVQLNLVAPLDLARLALPLLAAAPGGLVVNVGSVFGAIGYPGNAVYCASKFGLRGFSEALRREVADTRVGVLHVAPRATRTALNPPAVEQLNRQLGNRVDDPAEVATRILRAIDSRQRERTFGWPERLFVRVNALLPSMVDAAIASKLALIKAGARLNRSTT